MPLLLLIGCSLWGRHTRGPDPSAEAWRAAQNAFGKRGEVGGPEAAKRALDAAIELNPRNLQAQGLRARLEWTYGFAAQVGLPEDDLSARGHYLNTAEIAYGCLQKDPAFVAALTADHGAFTAYGLAALPPEATSCLTWAVASTMSLTETRGTGAVLALWNAPLLLHRAHILDPEDTEGWLAWLDGQIALLNEPMDATTAIPQLVKAATANPTMALFRLDLPPAEAARLKPLPSPGNDAPNTWENRLAAAKKP